MALTPALAALGAKFAGMSMEADPDDLQLSKTGVRPAFWDHMPGCLCALVQVE